MSLQVVIGLCKRKETAALKSNRRFFGGMTICLLNDGFFSFAVARQRHCLPLFYCDLNIA